MINDEKYMQRAIDIAKKSSEEIPVGVVIVKDNQIISESYNSQHQDKKLISHAEIKALILAELKMDNKNIQSCTVYTTCEPCTMCAGALIYAKVDRIVYGATMSDIDPENNRIKVTIESLVENKVNAPIINQCMRQECVNSLYKRFVKLL